MDWRWDEAVSRYRDVATGRFLSRASVQSMLEKSLSAAFNAADTLAGYVANGTISTVDASAALWNEIRGEYIRQYLAGIGGKQVMTAADWGSVGNALREQRGWFDKFVKEWPNLSEGQIKMRVQMYINSAREAYQRAKSKVARKWGADEVRWGLGITEHCELCLEWASMGWQPIGKRGGFPTRDGESYPCDGKSCRGMTKCGCYLDFRNSETGKEYLG